MKRFNEQQLASASLKVAAMDIRQKEAVMDEIFKSQPNLLASVLVLPQMGNSLEHVEVLLNVLLVIHELVRASGKTLKQVSESEQDQYVSRFVAHLKSVGDLRSAKANRAIDAYVKAHPEKVLLAYAIGEMQKAGFTELQHDASKYLFISGIGLVNCVAYGKYL